MWLAESVHAGLQPKDQAADDSDAFIDVSYIITLDGKVIGAAASRRSSAENGSMHSNKTGTSGFQTMRWGAACGLPLIVRRPKLRCFCRCAPRRPVVDVRLPHFAAAFTPRTPTFVPRLRFHRSLPPLPAIAAATTTGHSLFVGARFYCNMQYCNTKKVLQYTVYCNIEEHGRFTGAFRRRCMYSGTGIYIVLEYCTFGHDDILNSSVILQYTVLE